MQADQGTFTFDMAGVDRGLLLIEAAALLDARRGVLGDKKSRGSTPEGKAVRGLNQEMVKFASEPEIYRITDNDFLKRQRGIPVRFQELANDFNFYWLRFPVYLRPKRGWPFRLLELEVVFNPGENNRPKAYQILPDPQFETKIKGQIEVKLVVNGDFEFSGDTGELSAAAGPLSGKANVKADAAVGLGAGAVLGPLKFRVGYPSIYHTGTGIERVFWRIHGGAFFQKAPPDFVVMLQVPKETQQLAVTGQLQAYRSFNLLENSFQEAVHQLPAVFRSFIEAGVPVHDKPKAPWDLTKRL
jgi:hypothetical protein